MTPRHKQRMAFGVLVFAAVSVATALVLYSFEQNLLYFYTPTQVQNGEVSAQHPFNIGGLVVAGSVKREGTTVAFDITDTAHTVSLIYTGLLPDLFREMQGIVATGRLDYSGIFVAERVLAKHDENYMPPEVAQALKQAGQSRPIGIRP